MRFLIWGVSFGHRHGRMIALWAEALRRFGRWSHEIVVLGDQLASPPALERQGVRLIDVTADTAKIVNWEPRRGTSLKPWILKHVDPSRYDYLLYLDADVLATGPRLEALVASKAARRVIAVQEDIITIGGGHRSQGRETLTDAEKVKFGHLGICAGIVGVPTDETGLGLLRAWGAALAARKHPVPPWDQPYLIPLLLRQYAGRWEFMGDTAIGRNHGHQETLIHYTNGGGVAEKKAGREGALFRERFALLAAAARSSAA